MCFELLALWKSNFAEVGFQRRKPLKTEALIVQLRDSGSGDGFGVYEFDASRRFRYGIAISPEAFDVKWDGFPDEPVGFFVRGSRGNAAGQVRNISAVARICLLNDNCVALHGKSFLVSPACFRILRIIS